jgi:cellulose biosynthesis protein BcsQ
MRITSINSGKGRSLKSTTAWALSTWLNNNGYKALVIDFEPNATVTGFFWADYQTKPTMYRVFNNEVIIEEAIRHTEQGHVRKSR